MDKNAIKKFAVWARRELITRVGQRAAYFGITAKEKGNPSDDSVNGKLLSSSEKKERQALIARIREKGYEEVMEEAAYTWFNRFSALRFMEVNGYLPTHIRIFTDEENHFAPQILAEAIDLDLDGLDMEKVYTLKSENRTDELFKYLIITQCNALSECLPKMFQKIEDYTELLFPDNLLRQGSVIEQMITLIPEEDWKDQVQIIGWLYQYYNSEKKDDVFAALKKNIKITKENIPAVTQLFTPDWIVRYMVENSLGRIWVEGHPDTRDQLLPTEEEQTAYIADHSIKDGKWHYFLEEAEQEPEVQKQLDEIHREYSALNPEDIKCIDPCCGSGHILAYMFDVLVQIYEANGYTTRDAVRSIVENNIYGLDIDDRAAQLAYFSVMMKGRQYDSRFFKRGVQPHVYAIVESNQVDKYALEYFCNGDEKLTKAMKTIVKELHDAKEYGSILTVTPQDWEYLYERFEEIKEDISWYKDSAMEMKEMVQVAEALAKKYEICTTNPPYMGGSGMSAKLSEFVKKHYPDSKSDLFSVCIEKGNNIICKNGLNCMVTMQSWMFLSSFEKMRTKILHTRNITNLMHMENMVMGIAFGTAVTVLQNNYIKDYKGTYNQIKLSDIEENEPKTFPVIENKFAQTSSYNFGKIPGSPIAYWVNDELIELFQNSLIATYTYSDGQNKTGNNDRFIRSWWEIIDNTIGKGKRWVLCARGGAFRKWYGNIEEVIDWSDAARNHYRKDHVARIVPENIWFKTGFTWSRITSYKPSFRLQLSNMLFEMTGLTLFANNEEDIPYIIAMLNSCVAEYLLKIITQVMTIQLRDIQAIPLIIQQKEKVVTYSSSNIALSRDDWDSFETSWNFQSHPLILRPSQKSDAEHIQFAASRMKALGSLEWHYNQWKQQCEERFNQLKANEEELNRIFIDIYGLQDELTPEVEEKDVTVRQADLQRDIKSLISYAVGCMFGRYSLDVEGLAYADGDWDASKYQTYPADKDNIIPICDDEYFEDDIVNRFVKFIETVYGADTLEENLKFISDALGGKGQPRDVIRNYFMNDFYADHLKIYQKRPIYWLFDSGKRNGFKCLIYMHRYQPDTIARIRTDYVHEQQSRYRTAIADIDNRIANTAVGERVKLGKQLKKITEQAEELRLYEEKIHHLADQMISIDLDDGVKVNYAKFQDVLAKIK